MIKRGRVWVIANVLNCSLEESEVESQLRYLIHFSNETLEKVLTPL